MAQLDVGRAARRTAERRRVDDQAHLLQQAVVERRRVGTRVEVMVDAQRRVRIGRTDEVLIHRLGRERQERGQQLHELDQHMVERGVGSGLVSIGLALPEAAARAADVPVRQVVEQQFQRGRGPLGIPGVQRGAHVQGRFVQPCDNPVVELI